MIMVQLLRNKSMTRNFREMGPALAILLATLAISTFITEFTFTFGFTALWKTLFRFLRLSLVLTLPLFLLPGICARVQGFFNRGRRQLVQIQEDRDALIHPLKNWAIRPFQGIGLGMLVAAALNAIGRNPEASGNIQINMFIGIAFTEAVSIYALVVSLILIFAAK